MRRRGRPRHPDILTPREWEVLALIREGMTNPAIAARLGIGREGVKSHVSEILGKLGVTSREDAARWEPSERPWWAGAAAPMAWLWRRAHVSWLATGVAGVTAVLVVAGVGLLVWGLVRTDGDGAEPAAAPSALVGDVLACIREKPASAEGLAATASLRGASIRVSNMDVPANQAAQLLSLLRDVEPAYLGVRGTPGTRIGEGRMAGPRIDIELAEGSLALKYVRAGPVAPYGLLFDPALVNAWELVMLLNPPGYAQSVCTVPPEFDRVMADLGFIGQDPVDILETRLVLVADAQRDYGLVEQIEVWREGEARRELSLATVEGFAQPLRWNEFSSPLVVENQTGPLEPFTGEPLSMEVRFTGIDPFPEAVRPAEYLYYSADATGSSRGVLVPLTDIAIYNGGSKAGDAFFPGAELDQLLQEAASHDPAG